MTATIWRTCPSCGASFEQPDDPSRKRVDCSRACQQAAYRARQRTSAGHHHSSGQPRTGRQDQRRQRAGSQRPGANQRQERQDHQHHQRRPPPGSVTAGSSRRRLSGRMVFPAGEGIGRTRPGAGSRPRRGRFRPRTVLVALF
jgi:hypothetical protein